MRKIKSINLDESLFPFVDKESNFSNLVNKLLADHYAYSQEKLDVLQEEKKLLDQKIQDMINKKKEFESKQVEVQETTLKIVKEQEYEKEIKQIVESIYDDKSLYNAIYLKFRHLPKNLKHFEQRAELTKKALKDSVLAQKLREEFT